MVHVNADADRVAAEAVRRIIQAYARGRGLSESYASRRLSGSGETLRRLAKDGATLASRRAAAILQAASNEWPPRLPWPASIRRPAPAIPQTDTSLRNPKPVGDPVAAVADALERRFAAELADDDAAAAAAEADALQIGMRRNASGRIASPAALCAALGLSRKTYYDAVARYARGRRARPPRRRSATARMLTALEAAGDVRFTPSAKEAA